MNDLARITGRSTSWRLSTRPKPDARGTQATRHAEEARQLRIASSNGMPCVLRGAYGGARYGLPLVLLTGPSGTFAN